MLKMYRIGCKEPISSMNNSKLAPCIFGSIMTYGLVLRQEDDTSAEKVQFLDQQIACSYSKLSLKYFLVTLEHEIGTVVCLHLQSIS